MRKSIEILICIFLVYSVALAQDTTVSSFKKTNILKTDLLMPSVGIGLGFYSRMNNVPLNKFGVKTHVAAKFSSFHSDMDDYFQFAPIGLVYGLHFTNLNQNNTLKNKTFALAGAHIFMAAMVYPMKYAIADQRPHSSATDAFPSGHTAEAFLAAQYLWKEYGKEYPIIGVIGYGFAATTGIFRILNNRHWSADVFAGAGIGILSVNLAYLCLDWYKKHHIKTHSLKPS